MRYEKKYSLSNISADFVRQTLYNHPAAFRKLFPDRQVNNIYLDSPGLTAYHENVAGISQRKKFRLRWYGDGTQYLTDPVFEIKIRENQLGRKENFPVSSLSWQQLPAFFARFEPVWQHALQPVLINAYRRTYYGSADGRFRLTLDWDLHFGSYSFDRYRTGFSLPNQLILELKYEETAEGYLDQITQYLPFRPTRSSKYVTGINMIFGG